MHSSRVSKWSKTTNTQSTIRLYLADDHKAVRESFRAMLCDVSAVELVGEAANGRDAVHGILTMQPDVALLDISMPYMNGIEVVRLLRAQSDTTRILMWSMHSSSEMLAAAIDAGADGYVLKDSDFEEILKAIRVVHSGGKHIDQRLT